MHAVYFLAAAILLYIFLMSLLKSTGPKLQGGNPCASKPCNSDDDCDYECFCHPSQKQCLEGGKCSSCMVACLAGGDSKDTCCEVCPPQSQYQDCNC